MIAIAEEYLKKMKPNIAGWEADFGNEMMTKGKAWLNFTLKATRSGPWKRRVP